LVQKKQKGSRRRVLLIGDSIQAESRERGGDRVGSKWIKGNARRGKGGGGLKKKKGETSCEKLSRKKYAPIKRHEGYGRKFNIEIVLRKREKTKRRAGIKMRANHNKCYRCKKKEAAGLWRRKKLGGQTLEHGKKF